jgi:hypothetical protein
MTNRLIDVHGYEDGMSPTGNPYNVPLSVANMLIYAGRASLSASNAVSGSPEDGFAGFTGWTAIPSMTIYQGKLVMHLHWVGGTGTAPTAGYVGPNKLVTIPADAVDMVWRMYQGEDTTEQGVAGTPVVGKSGWSPVPTLVADGARQVMHITWSGGTGTPPPDGFVGAGELVATAALAVNLKGESVAAGPHQHAVSDVAGLEAAMGAKADLVGGKLDLSQLPDIAVSDYLGVAATQAAMLALTGQKGDWCSRADNGKVYIITGADPAVVGGWTQLSYPVPTLDLPGMTTAATAGTVAQKTAHRDALGLGPIATMTLPEAQYAVSGGNIPLAQRGAAGGVATLGSDLKIPVVQLPASANAALYAGGNLIANGNLAAGSNMNFARFTYDNVYAPLGAAASFKLPVSAGSSNVAIGDSTVMLASNNLLEFSCSMLLGSISGGSHSQSCIQYFYVNCYDADGAEITDTMGQTHPGSVNTTLAAALNPGDATVQLTSASGWAGAGTDWYQRAFRWWLMLPALGVYGYQEASGRFHPAYTYTRNFSKRNGLGGTWSSISGNTLTLSTALFPGGWDGPALPSGTPMQNCTGGGSNLYFSGATYALPGEYKVSGTMSADRSLLPKVVLHPGTSKIAIIGLLNYGGTGVSELRLANVILRYK